MCVIIIVSQPYHHAKPLSNPIVAIVVGSGDRRSAFKPPCFSILFSLHSLRTSAHVRCFLFHFPSFFQLCGICIHPKRGARDMEVWEQHRDGGRAFSWSRLRGQATGCADWSEQVKAHRTDAFRQTKHTAPSVVLTASFPRSRSVERSIGIYSDIYRTQGNHHFCDNSSSFFTQFLAPIPAARPFTAATASAEIPVRLWRCCCMFSFCAVIAAKATDVTKMMRL